MQEVNEFAGWIWLAGLLLAFLLLYIVAKCLPKSPQASEPTLIDAHTPSEAALRLQRQLESGFDVQLVARSNRLLFIRQGVQQAAIILDDEAVMPERFLDQVLLLSLPTTFSQADVLVAKAKIHAHLAKLS